MRCRGGGFGGARVRGLEVLEGAVGAGEESGSCRGRGQRCRVLDRRCGGGEVHRKRRGGAGEESFEVQG
jgi:hypothetical protein